MARYAEKEAPLLERIIMQEGLERTKAEDWARDEITRLSRENARLRELIISAREENARLREDISIWQQHFSDANHRLEKEQKENAQLQAQREKDKRLNHETESGLLEENVRLREENARLREALKPFAEMLKGNYSHQLDDMPIKAGSNQYDLVFVFTLGDLRAAAAAIREGGK